LRAWRSTLALVSSPFSSWDASRQHDLANSAEWNLLATVVGNRHYSTRLKVSPLTVTAALIYQVKTVSSKDGLDLLGSQPPDMPH